jgi:hypothetical protein
MAQSLHDERCILSDSKRTIVLGTTPDYPPIPHQSLPLRFHPVLRTGSEAEAVLNGSNKSLISLKKLGAGEGIRTLDPNLGKVAELLPRDGIGRRLPEHSEHSRNRSSERPIHRSNDLHADRIDRLMQRGGRQVCVASGGVWLRMA